MITDSLDLLHIQWIFTDSYLRIIKSDGGCILVWYHFYVHSSICIQSVVKNLFTTSQYKICIKISYLNNFEWIYFKINYWILLDITEYYWILLNITEYYWILNITEFFKSLNIQMRGLLNIQLLQVSLTVLTVSEFIFPGNIHCEWIYLPSRWVWCGVKAHNGSILLGKALIVGILDTELYECKI